MTYHLLTHPNPTGPNYYAIRDLCKHGKGIHLIVIHTAESLPDWTGPDTGAEKVANYASTTTRNVSWHSTVDSDSTIPMLPDSYTAWHASSYNRCSLGVEIATQAAKWYGSSWEWREAILTNTARVVADWCVTHNIPAKYIDRVAADDGLSGIVSHASLDPERRTDPGHAFPWDWFIAKVALLAQGAAPVAPVVIPTAKTPVMGNPVATVEQATQWAVDGAKRKGSPYLEVTIRQIVSLYYAVGREYGVKPDLALAQSAKETGLWAYGGDVKSTQWNMAGIGATGGIAGIVYNSPEAGVRSHVLRMRMYARNDPLAYSLAVLVRALPSSHWGAYPNIEDFNGHWAVPGVGYGESVVKDYLNPMIITVVRHGTTTPDPAPLSSQELIDLRAMLAEWKATA